MPILYTEQTIEIIYKEQPRTISAQVGSSGLAYHRTLDEAQVRYTVTHVASGLVVDGRWSTQFHTTEQAQRYIELVDCLTNWRLDRQALEERHYAELLCLRADLAVAAKAVLNGEELLLPYTLKYKILGQRVETHPILVTSEAEAIKRFETKLAELQAASTLARFLRLFAPGSTIPMREHLFPGIAVPGRPSTR